MSLDKPLASPAHVLPLFSLLAFATIGFIAILTETLPAGLLPQISAGLAVTEAQAGQLVTLYALGAIMAAIPLITLTRHWDRKPLMLAAIIGFLIFNTITAFSSHYTLTLVARFLAGMASGLSWGLLAGYARRLVQPSLQGRAIAIAMLGTPVALSVGLPASTWLGIQLGWRFAFGLMSALTLLLVIWVWRQIPNVPGQKKAHALSLSSVFHMPGIRPCLAGIFLWMLAHNLLYTYIAPFLVGAGLLAHVDLVLLVFGLTSLAGIFLTGLLIQRHLRRLTLLSLVGFALSATLMGLWHDQPILVFMAVALWGFIFGGAATLVVTAIADAAGEGGDLAQSMVVTTWNTAIAAGSFFGGIILPLSGAASLPWLALPFILMALMLVWANRRYAFKPS